jgi:hypothetical protein
MTVASKNEDHVLILLDEQTNNGWIGLGATVSCIFVLYCWFNEFSWDTRIGLLFLLAFSAFVMFLPNSKQSLDVRQKVIAFDETSVFRRKRSKTISAAEIQSIAASVQFEGDDSPEDRKRVNVVDVVELTLKAGGVVRVGPGFKRELDLQGKVIEPSVQAKELRDRIAAALGVS